MDHTSVSQVVASFLMLATAVAAVVLRILSIRIRKASLKVHDYLTFLALFSLIGYVLDTLAGAVKGGYGTHISDLPLNTIVVSHKVFWASEWLWATSVAAFRLAILSLYIEIFQVSKFHRVAFGTAIVVAMYWIASMLTILLLCRPIAYNWDFTIQGVCGDVVKTEYASAIFNMLVDLVVVFLPLPIVWKLRMARSKKWGIMGVFALGLITISINLGRLIQTSICPTDDFTYCARDSSLLVIAEMTTGIIVSCIPTLGVLIFRREKQVGRHKPRDATPSIGSHWNRRQRIQKGDTTLFNDDDGLELNISDPERSHTIYDKINTPVMEVRC